MSRTDAAENDYGLLMFNNDTWAAIGDATGIVGSTVDGVFHVSLHTSDPGETGDQTTNEASYGSYLRVSVARTTGGWTISGTAPTNATNAAIIPFAEASSGSETITHFGIGTDTSGTGNLLWSGALDTSRLVTTGITPSFAAGALDIDFV